jgi:predicted nucleic acid-binding protein
LEKKVLVLIRVVIIVTFAFMIKLIYIDTSVFGGYFDKEFEKETKPFFERILEKQIKIIVSEILELELYRAPNYIRDFFESLPDNLIVKVELTDEARELSEKYISEKVVGKTSHADCQHIALATINKADVLASWNFKHIVNLERIRGYNSIKLPIPFGQVKNVTLYHD